LEVVGGRGNSGRDAREQVVLTSIHLPQRGEVASAGSARAGGGLLMAVERARSLRKNMTETARVLWRSLRQFKPAGVHFRRQVPIGYYIADFACHRAKVIVELDGSQHGKDEAVVYDLERTAFLESRGYHVLRFWNDEILKNPETVAEFILAESVARLSPHP
jgi:very-short-patch-repair endonuclease